MSCLHASISQSRQPWHVSGACFVTQCVMAPSCLVWRACVLTGAACFSVHVCGVLTCFHVHTSLRMVHVSCFTIVFLCASQARRACVIGCSLGIVVHVWCCLLLRLLWLTERERPHVVSKRFVGLPGACRHRCDLRPRHSGAWQTSCEADAAGHIKTSATVLRGVGACSRQLAGLLALCSVGAYSGDRNDAGPTAGFCVSGTRCQGQTHASCKARNLHQLRFGISMRTAIHCAFVESS